MSTRRTWLLAAGSWAAALLSACSMLDGPRTVTLSEGELQQRVERAFPVERRVLEVFDVSLGTPRLTLLPERNRIATELSVAARERVLGGRWSGQLAFDAALRWDAVDQTLRLSEVRVQRFTFDGSGGGRPAAERLAAVLAEQVLENRPIYRLTPERAARLEQAGVMPGSVAVTRGGVEVTLQPVSK
ncbi:MAG: DUF1439 domain-containing protein [Rubrivivax sp.]|nr:DUF1439 domain-containing protein [Rubrivivax sp.]